MPDQNTIQQFSQTLNNPLILPADPGYDEARSVWNGMSDKKPAMIAMCTDVNDITNCVNFARRHNILVSIKGGGHNVAGRAVCDDGLMINLSLMKSVVVNPDTKTVKVGAGATLGDLDQETQKFGLAVPVGIFSPTGIAGLTLGGGIGHLARKFGLALDNLISVELITVDGNLINASEHENPDLFWALRGGGGNFGIVSSFEFRLHKVGPDVVVARVFYPIEDAKKVLQFYREFSANAPDEIAGYAFILNVPPADPFPKELQGETAIAIVACHCGALEDGKIALSSLEDFGNPFFKAIMPMPFVAFQSNFDPGSPKGMRYYWKSHYMDMISDEAIDVLVNHLKRLPGPFSAAGFEPLGGAISRVNEQDTAFPQRSASYAFSIWSGWSEPGNDRQVIKWTRDLSDKMTPYASGGVYSNYLDQDDGALIPSSFGKNYKRLQEVKKKYDPNNFFRINNNIVPNI